MSAKKNDLGVPHQALNYWTQVLAYCRRSTLGKLQISEQILVDLGFLIGLEVEQFFLNSINRMGDFIIILCKEKFSLHINS